MIVERAIAGFIRTSVSIIVLPTKKMRVESTPSRARLSVASGLCVKHQREIWSVRTRLISSGIVRSKLRSPASRCAIGMPSFDGGECTGQRRVDVSRDDQRQRTHVVENLLDALECPASLGPVASRPDVQLVVGRADPQLAQEDLRHLGVVMLAGVDDQMIERDPPGAASRRSSGAIFTKFGRAPTRYAIARLLTKLNLTPSPQSDNPHSAY